MEYQELRRYINELAAATAETARQPQTDTWPGGQPARLGDSAADRRSARQTETRRTGAMRWPHPEVKVLFLRWQSVLGPITPLDRLRRRRFVGVLPLGREVSFAWPCSCAGEGGNTVVDLVSGPGWAHRHAVMSL